MPWVQVFLPKPGSEKEYDLTKNEIAKVLLEELQETGTKSYRYVPGSPLPTIVPGPARPMRPIVDVRYIGTFPLEKSRRSLRGLLPFSRRPISSTP